MMARGLVWLIGAAASALSIGGGAHTVLAQAVGQAAPVPPGLGDMLSNPGEWMTTVLNAVLVGVAQRTTSDAVGFMNWLLGSGNIISQTPPALSYANEAVIRLWDLLRTVANAGLAVVTVWGGVNVMTRSQTRAPYHGALELIPRVVLSAILINTSLYWGHFVIDLNNELCRAVGAAAIPGWSLVNDASATAGLLNIVAVAIYLLMGLLLLTQMLMRLALLDALLVIGPLALLCWVLPQTYSWARLWFSTFFGTVFVQAIQVLVLELGAQLVHGLPTLLPNIAANPADGGRLWLMTVLLGVAVLQLARTVPRLMPGYPGGGGMPAAAGLGSVRMVQSVVRLARAGSGGR